MRRALSCLSLTLALSLLLILIPQPTRAQESRHFNLSAGGGFSAPTADASGNFNTGWNVNFRGGLNVSQSLLTDLDFTYNRWNLTRSALVKFGEPGGYANVWSLSFEPMVRILPRGPLNPYILAGAGLYHRRLTLTQPALFTTIVCDPFFGFCFPAVVRVNQVVATFSTYKPGFNAGRGLEFRFGHEGLKAFAEARYNEMFTTLGTNLSFVPVTFGIRW